MKSIILSFAILLMAVSTFSQTPANKQVVSPSEALYPPMIFVKGGVFQMGSDSGIADEKPRHSITINSYSMGKYEVSQDLWQQIMGSNPSGFKGCGLCPVEQVTWKDIQKFLKILNKRTGNRYRLPTEAEWEYAAEGGENSKGYKYSGSNDPAEVGWIKSNAENKTHPCGEKKPNELGIYDMCGNVWEICSDWYSKGYYKKSPAVNPVNNNAGLFRVVRGGSWRSGPERCYNTARNRNIRDHHIQNGGFRLALDK